jgi:NADH-quinone oxidoreductase subunit D
MRKNMSNNMLENRDNEQIIKLNMGPQHPSTHGVLRLKLELIGEKVKSVTPVIGYLHTGIEKNTEKHTWNQAITDVTRMDYVSNISHEVAYCLAVEKLLNITNDIPKKASVIRVLFLEASRIASHLAAVGTSGNELGGTTLMTLSFQAREYVLSLFAGTSGARMNNAFIRIGGVASDSPHDVLKEFETNIKTIKKGIDDIDKILSGNPIFKMRCKNVAVLSLDDCIKFGVTGPILRSAGSNKDLRKTNPYSDYQTYDFDTVFSETADAWGRYLVRMEEMRQSLKIIKQCIERLKDMDNEQKYPVMIQNKHIGNPSHLTVSADDGQGQSEEYLKTLGFDFETVKNKDNNYSNDQAYQSKESNNKSMEALIRHFKLLTDGFTVPAGETFQMVEDSRGIICVTVISNGKNKPYRVHFSDPSFTNLQSLETMCKGNYLADIVVALGSLDPVCGSVDR